MTWRTFLLRSRLRPGVMLAIIAIAEYGAPWTQLGRVVTLGLASVLTAHFLVQSLRHFRMAALVPVLKIRLLELALTAASLALLVSKAVAWTHELAEPARAGGMDNAYRQYAGAYIVVAGLRLLVGNWSLRRLFRGLEMRPAQTVALGFAGTILAGTLLLSLPVSVRRLEDLSLLDVLFTAISAVTVTGLVVYDPATFHTPVGQTILLALIQVGGIGTMVASASLVVLSGRRLRLRGASALREAMDLETVGEVRSQVKAILGVTLGCELIGTLLLYGLWHDRPGVDAPAAAALFHAVSAFCNAGFSLFPTGLVAFRDDAATCAVIAALIVLGGLGFPVLREGLSRGAAVWARRRPPGLSLHARMALTTTGALLATGMLGVLVFDWNASLAPLSWLSRLTVSAFLSVTARTAGFTTVPIEALSPANLWLLIVLMFIGGNPGSAAGGIKTTSAATVVAAVRATLVGRARVEAFRRTIPDEQVAKALAVVGASVALVAGAVLALLATQEGDPLALTFEAVSAFGTVGLSAVGTPGLDGWGKAIAMVLMFVGRTGPLTLGFALAARSARRGITYPNEKIMIG